MENHQSVEPDAKSQTTPPLINHVTLINEERERFKDGLCPKCKGKLYRYVTSFSRDTFHYGQPTCEKCKGEFIILFSGISGKDLLPDPSPLIKKTGEEAFWKLLNTPFTI